MKIEKPISTIRKAIKGSAEEMASKELFEKLEQRHYDYIINLFKQMRDIDPEILKKMIIIAAKGKDLKDEVGTELYKTFNLVWDELINGYQGKLRDAISQITEATNSLPEEKATKEIFNFAERFLNKTAIKLKKDTRIISAFSGKEELLNKQIDYIISSLFSVLKDFDKYFPE